VRGLYAVLLLCACGRVGFEADPGDGGFPAIVCNSIVQVHDDFEAATIDNVYLWGSSFAAGTTSYAASGGDLVLTLEPNAAASTYVGLATPRGYDLSGQRIMVEVAKVADNTATTGFHLENDDYNYIGVAQNAGKLHGSTAIMGNYTEIAPMPYDPVQHRFFAISESGGTYSFETSADGVTFHEFASTTVPSYDPHYARVNLYAGTDNPEASPGAAHIASIGRVVAGAASCPANTLSDDFNDGVTDDRWRPSENACCTVKEQGGTLQFTMDGTAGPGVAEQDSHAGYDLRGGQVTVKLVADPQLPTVTATLGAYHDSTRILDIEVTSTQVTTHTYDPPNGPHVTPSLRNSAEKYLRIRESGGTVFFEVSTDKSAWRLLDSSTPSFALDDLIFGLRGSVTSAVGPDSVQFDDFNVP
jgi:hypothetical protein